jgi:oxygen-independent coproporphyrinogen-3 oxidase
MTAPTLHQRLAADPYQGYAYAYPHKTAYRHFPSPLPLRDLWQPEARDHLYLYVHLPFCEMRCGFCNLFTTTHGEPMVDAYLTALETQAVATAEALGEHRFTRAAIGGGTPTFLSAGELDRMFRMLKRRLVMGSSLPLSCELSPATTEADKLAVLREHGVTRVSVGIQSLIEEETRRLGRPQSPRLAQQALRDLKAAGFPVLNADLIYGIEGQTTATWLESLQAVTAWEPEELFLYPLYVRPLTGLDRSGGNPSDSRLDLYRAGRDFLLERGYAQISKRLFRKAGLATERGEEDGYCCQEDGMVGLGAGARSYTREVHYCTEYAVGRTGVRAIIADYIRRSAAEHGTAVYGCRLDSSEQRRRYLIKSLLRSAGLSEADYEAWFGSAALEDFPQLAELLETGLAERHDGVMKLNRAGFEREDTIGPWLYSDAIAAGMETYEFT